MEIYLVGGAVRDRLLGLPVIEHDYVVVGSTPAEMLALGYKPVGKDFPVFLHPKTHAEYALARTERKTGRGYSQFAFHTDKNVTLADDLKRRDLTINAIAMTENQQIIDPYNGQHDLQQKILRHVSEAFIEDPVRLLRIARFYARFAPLGFTIASDTMNLLRAMVNNGEIDHLVPERVWQETVKALQEAQPSYFFKALRECGALAILFPELERLFGVPNPPKWHPEIDSGVHTMMVLEQATLLSADPKVRFAALVHDLGKGLTKIKYWPKHHGHEESGARLVKQLCERLKTPKDYKELALLVCQYHGLVHKIFELKADTLLKFLEKLDVLRRPERFQQFLLGCLADARGRPGFEQNNYPQLQYLQQAQALIAEVDVKQIREQHETMNTFLDALRKARLVKLSKLKRTE